jgi:hypothetical protein
VDVTATRAVTVRCFGTRIRNVDYFSLNPRRPICGPAVTIVAGLKYRVKRDARVEIGRLRNRRPVLEAVQISGIARKRNAGAGTLQRQQ